MNTATKACLHHMFIFRSFMMKWIGFWIINLTNQSSFKEHNYSVCPVLSIYCLSKKWWSYIFMSMSIFFIQLYVHSIKNTKIAFIGFFWLLSKKGKMSHCEKCVSWLLSFLIKPLGTKEWSLCWPDKAVRRRWTSSSVLKKKLFHFHFGSF